MRSHGGIARVAALFVFPALLLLAGCANGLVTAMPANANFAIFPGTSSIDTNCTGCNAINSKGTSVERFRASLANGESADVTWSVSGGDPNSGPGNISASGLYTPPSYLTSDRVQVVVTATLASNQRTATSVLTVTPGFLQPLTPENAALGPNGQTTLTAFLAWFGGAGYLLTRYSGLWVGFGLLVSVLFGLIGGGIVFLFLSRVLISEEENMDPADYEMVGVLGKISSSIRESGTGELVYTQMGTRRVCGARSDDGSAIAKGTEVMVTRYEKGIAYVRLWTEMSGDE